MPSFATEVKTELARLNYEQSCCRTAELAALLRMGATITFGLRRTFGLNFTTKNAAVARKTLQLLKSEGGNIRTEIIRCVWCQLLQWQSCWKSWGSCRMKAST